MLAEGALGSQLPDGGLAVAWCSGGAHYHCTRLYQWLQEVPSQETVGGGLWGTRSDSERKVEGVAGLAALCSTVREARLAQATIDR